MVQIVDDAQLVSSLELCKESIKSLDPIFSIADNTELTINTQNLKKEIILGSFAIKMSHGNISDRESARKGHLLKSEILPYNENLVHLKRIDSDLTALKRQLNQLKDTMSLPVLSVACQTLLEASEDKFLLLIPKAKKENTLSPIELSELYSLSPQSNLLKPDLADVKKILDLETRKRLLLQIKHDILLQIKNSVLREKRQWKSRNANLNAFIDGDFLKVVAGISRVKAAELEKDNQFEANVANRQNEDSERNESPDAVDEEDEDQEMKD